MSVVSVIAWPLTRVGLVVLRWRILVAAAARRVALHERIRERRQRDLDRDGEAFRLITHF